MIIVHREDKWPRDCPAWKTNENIPRAALDCTGAAVKLLPKNPSPALIRDMTWSWMDLTDPCLHVCNQPSCRNPQVSFCTDPGITQETFFLAARFSIVLFCNKFLRATGRCLFFYLCISSITSLSLYTSSKYKEYSSESLPSFCHHLPWCSTLANRKEINTNYNHC